MYCCWAMNRPCTWLTSHCSHFPLYLKCSRKNKKYTPKQSIIFYGERTSPTTAPLRTLRFKFKSYLPRILEWRWDFLDQIVTHSWPLWLYDVTPSLADDDICQTNKPIASAQTERTWCVIWRLQHRILFSSLPLSRGWVWHCSSCTRRSRKTFLLR